jgi:Helix-turn-helix domain
MKKNASPKPGSSLTVLRKIETPGNEFIFHIPPGTKFSDIYMDAQEVAEELHICKRTVNKLRKAGFLSYTYLYKGGKIFYLRQEIAAILAVAKDGSDSSL